MNQRIKSVVINSSCIPESFLGSKQSTLCFHNINLFKKYAHSDIVRKSFYFSKKYARLSEYLIPKFSRSHSSCFIKPQERGATLKEEMKQKVEERRAVKKSIAINQVINANKNEANTLATHSSMTKRNAEKSQMGNSKNKVSMRINTPFISKMKNITLTPIIKKVVRTDYIRLKHLFKNETIKGVFKCRIPNNDAQEKKASIIE